MIPHDKDNRHIKIIIQSIALITIILNQALIIFISKLTPNNNIQPSQRVKGGKLASNPSALDNITIRPSSQRYLNPVFTTVSCLSPHNNDLTIISKSSPHHINIKI